MKRTLPFITAIFLTVVLFWQFFFKGFIPMPANFMAAWYEPWKSQYTTGGAPTIPHKAVGDDVFRQIYPLRTLGSDVIRQGSLPLWNPYNGAGQPLLATLHTGMSNPFSLLQLADSITGWAWYIILQLPLLFLVTYWYARILKISPFGALIAGVVVSFSGVITARLIYGDYVYALIGLPVLFAVVELVRAGSAQWSLMVPLIVSFVLICVQPQISAYVLATAVLYAFVRLKKGRLLFFFMALLGGGFAAFQLMPTLELYQYANVTRGSSAFIFQKFLMPLSHLVTIVIPNYFGNSGTYNFWGRSDYAETVASLGLLPVAFVLMGWWTRDASGTFGQIKKFFLVSIGVTILLTLDWIMPALLYSIPAPVLSTSIPSRVYLLTAFFVAVAAGIGIAQWEKQGISARKNAWRAAVIMGIVGFGIGIATVIMNRMGLIICPSQVERCANVALRNTVFELIVWFVGSGLLVLPFVVSRSWMQMFAKAGLVLLLVSAGTYNAWKFLPMSPRQYVGQDLAILAKLRALSPNRIAAVESAALATDIATQHRFFDTNYYDPLYIRRYGELVSYVNTGDRMKGLSRSDVNIVADATVSAALHARRERFWDMTGTAAIVTKKSDTLTIPGALWWEDADWQIHDRVTALPRAYAVDNIVVEPDDDKLLAGLFSTDTNLAATAFVEVPIEGLHQGPGIEKGNVDIVKYTANEVELSVNISGATSLVVLSDTYYPGWRARVDGVEQAVYRVNYAFRGIIVPEGAHRIEFWYEPMSLKIGAWITGISVGIWLIVVWVSIGRKRK